MKNVTMVTMLMVMDAVQLVKLKKDGNVLILRVIQLGVQVSADQSVAMVLLIPALTLIWVYQ